jgi:hypothetical protein
LGDIERQHAQALHVRELRAARERWTERVRMEDLLFAKRLRLELDNARRDAMRETMSHRSQATGDILQSTTALMAVLYMMIYQVQPTRLPPDSTLYSFSAYAAQIACAAGLDPTLVPDVTVSGAEGGTSPGVFALYAFALGVAVVTLALSVLMELLVHSRITTYNVHRPFAVASCGKRHPTFGSYFACHCARIESMARVCFVVGCSATVASATVAALAVTEVSFDGIGGRVASALFTVPVVCTAVVLAALAPRLMRDPASTVEVAALDGQVRPGRGLDRTIRLDLGDELDAADLSEFDAETRLGDETGAEATSNGLVADEGFELQSVVGSAGSGE